MAENSVFERQYDLMKSEQDKVLNELDKKNFILEKMRNENLSHIRHRAELDAELKTKRDFITRLTKEN